ncbi:MAG: hypothetical protein QGH27_07490, partial [SAR324 cluster bacterium]|nr:hypothetical protein [SAR324 cluster bacterium]
MFLPFLPLIVASTSLTLLAGVLERPEPWLKMSIWIVLPAILAFSVIVAQLRQNISLFSRAELTLFTEQDKPSSSKLTSKRIGIMIIWLAVVYGEHLDLRIAEIFEISMVAETISFGVLLLVYWLADALTAVPVYRWNFSGV